MTYPGGKGASGVIQTIINQQPPHDVYIEAFLGGGAVMRAKRPARVNIGIDLDPSTIASFGGTGSRAELLCCDAKRWLRDKMDWTGRELVYCDPPYRRNWAKMYRFEMDDIGHSALLAQLVRIPCMVQLSGYESLMYETWLKGWRMVKYQASTRHGVRTECLWMNYPEPNLLHDYRYLGSDYRERERIKRRARRWVCRLGSLPRLERLAIYGEITASLASFGDAAGSNPPDRVDPLATSGDAAGSNPPDRVDPLATSGDVTRRRRLSPDQALCDRAEPIQ